MEPNTVDRQSLRVWLLLAILGAILSVVGWYRVFTVVLVAQNASPPAFEVASVKPNKSGTVQRGGGPQPGRFVRSNVTLRQLIQMAYSQQAFDRREISGGPDWIDSERFDVEAKIDDGQAGNLGRLYLPDGKGSPGLAYQMVKTLLTDRFKLVVHSETRDRPVYALVLARADGRMGPQLQRSAVDCDAVMAAIVANGRPPGPAKTGGAPPCSMGGGAGRLMGNALTMQQIGNGLIAVRQSSRARSDRDGRKLRSGSRVDARARRIRRTRAVRSQRARGRGSDVDLHRVAGTARPQIGGDHGSGRRHRRRSGGAAVGGLGELLIANC